MRITTSIDFYTSTKIHRDLRKMSHSSHTTISKAFGKNFKSHYKFLFSLLSPPRKKRSKVTDSVRVKLNPIRDSANSLPASARSSPSLSSYFPPTMVSHPLYNGSSFGTDDRDESPVNSEDFSDGGPYDNNYSQRYSSSGILKIIYRF